MKRLKPRKHYDALSRSQQWRRRRLSPSANTAASSSTALPSAQKDPEFPVCNSDSSDNGSRDELVDSNVATCDNDACSEEANSEVDPLSSEESDCEEQSFTATDLRTSITQWASENQVPNLHLTKLLKVLKKYPDFSNLPADARTLLKTPRTVKMRTCTPGNYVNLGLADTLLDVLDMQTRFPSDSIIRIQWNIDGLPLSKSSRSELWPILGHIKGFLGSPFIIGAYHGNSKPFSVEDYLKDFIEESNIVLRDGLMHNETNFSVRYECFICDKPAKSFLLNTKSHNAYNGCGKCQQRGLRIGSRMTFPEEDSELRTDISFEQQMQPNHHKGATPLLSLHIPFGCVSQVPNDPMHLVDLGVQRRLVNLWINGILTRSQIRTASALLENLRFLTPTEFSRKSRSLIEIDRWKSTEFRALCLYTGIFVFADLLPKKMFEHYVEFCIAIRILRSCDYEKYDYADKLLRHFVKTFPEIYGAEYISNNVHSLVHLANDAKVFGPLDNFSAYPFENFLHSLKRKVRSGNHTLQQIVNRTIEQRGNKVSSQVNKQDGIVVSCEHNNGPLPDLVGNPQYGKVVLNGKLILKCTSPDNFCRTNIGVIQVVNIATSDSGKAVLVGRLCSDTEFITKPFSLGQFGIYKAIAKDIVVVPTDEVICKSYALNKELDSTGIETIYTLSDFVNDL